jgi:tetratricopeptide (TPR) repeat protein
VSPLRSVWGWLSKTKNQKTFAIIGGGLAAVIGGAWQVYLHVSEAPVTIGITLEQYETGLKRREQEVRAELREASAADKDKIALLEKQLAEIQDQLKNPASALEDYKAKLAQAYKAFDDLKREVLPEQIKQAQDALTKGETAAAERLFTQVLTRGTENAAEAAYQLGQLAYGRIDYQTADRYYRQAVDLQPDNPLYLNQAGLIAHTMGHYSEAKPLLQRALALREKALDPDHPDVAQSLNNLAALYWAQGPYAKAEPLLQRSLAIREKALGPDHPNVATSLNNLAELYRAQGAYAKAKPLLQRSLVIQEKALGPDHPNVAQSLENYAALLRKLDRTAEAETMEVRAKAIRATR